MAGKFLKRDAIIDTVISEQRMNALRKRTGMTKHPVRVTSCGCPDPSCGAFHMIIDERTIPTPEECAVLITNDNKSRKSPRKGPRA